MRAKKNSLRDIFTVPNHSDLLVPLRHYILSRSRKASPHQPIMAFKPIQNLWDPPALVHLNQNHVDGLQQPSAPCPNVPCPIIRHPNPHIFATARYGHAYITEISGRAELKFINSYPPSLCCESRFYIVINRRPVPLP
jgi:hypothetical protein